MTTILLIDGNGLVHRAFHALPEFSTKQGVYTNAVYGFATVLNKAIADFNPSNIAVCFDTKAPIFRDNLYKKYRAQRPQVKQELIVQFPLIKDFLSAAGIYQIEKDGLEADDLIGIIATKIRNKVKKIIILSADKDLLQLINKNTFVLTPQLGFGKTKLYAMKDVVDRIGVKPDQIPDFKALAGDPSDNYAGIPGIGPKTAINLINQFKTLDNLYRHLPEVESKKIGHLLRQYRENAALSKKLATILVKDHIDFPIDATRFGGYNETLRSFFEKMEFRSLENRFFPSKNPVQKKELAVKKKIDQPALF